MTLAPTEAPRRDPRDEAGSAHVLGGTKYMRSDFKGSGREGGSGEPPITAATPTDGERAAAAAGFVRLPRAGRCLVGEIPRQRRQSKFRSKSSPFSNEFANLSRCWPNDRDCCAPKRRPLFQIYWPPSNFPLFSLEPAPDRRRLVDLLVTPPFRGCWRCDHESCPTPRPALPVRWNPSPPGRAAEVLHPAALSRARTHSRPT